SPAGDGCGQGQPCSKFTMTSRAVVAFSRRMLDTKMNWVTPGILLVTLAWMGTACDSRQNDAVRTTGGPDTNPKIFYVKGVLKELKPDGRTAIIEHEEIP